MASSHRRPPAIIPLPHLLWRFGILLFRLPRSQGFGHHFLQCSESRYRGFWGLLLIDFNGLCLSGSTHFSLKSWGIRSMICLLLPLYKFHISDLSLFNDFGFLSPTHSLFRVRCFAFRCAEWSDYYLRSFLFRQPFAVECSLL